jgi:RNA polymerase sigma factor (sigma-70 family)
VFLEAWRLRGKVQPEGASLLPWLLGIATNVMHRRRRFAGRHQALLERLALPEMLPDFADEVVGRLEDAERIAAVRDVLQRLPRADRDVLALCVWAQLDYAAAAEALGVPVGTVRSRLSRARQRLDRLAKEVRDDRELGSETWQLTVDRTPAVRP